MIVIRLLGSLVLLVVFLASSSSAEILAGPVVNPANGHMYYLLKAAQAD